MDRFWSKVDKTDACWIWTGALDHGCGKAWFRGRLDYAHRVAYIQAHGSIPDGMHIDHLCRNRACVNPAHLEAVSQVENNRRAGVILRTGKCSRGHEVSMYGGERRCRECFLENRRKRRAAQKAVA